MKPSLWEGERGCCCCCSEGEGLGLGDPWESKESSPSASVETPSPRRHLSVSLSNGPAALVVAVEESVASCLLSTRWGRSPMSSVSAFCSGRGSGVGRPALLLLLLLPGSAVVLVKAAVLCAGLGCDSNIRGEATGGDVERWLVAAMLPCPEDEVEGAGLLARCLF